MKRVYLFAIILTVLCTLVGCTLSDSTTEPTVQESTVQEPTTQEPTTQEPKKLSLQTVEYNGLTAILNNKGLPRDEILYNVELPIPHFYEYDEAYQYTLIYTIYYSKDNGIVCDRYYYWAAYSWGRDGWKNNVLIDDDWQLIQGGEL